MDEIPTNPILEFNPNQLEEVRKLFNYDDLSRLKQDLNIFEKWIKMQQHYLVTEYDKAYLERYLINSKGSIERAKKLFDKFCTLRGLMPDFMQGYDIENEFQNLFQVVRLYVLPKPTAENYRLIFFEIFNPDAELFVHREVNRYMIVLLHYLICHDYSAGIQIVCDTRNFTFGIIAKLNPILVANTITIMVEALGLRLRGIHFIGGSKFLDAILNIMKQGLSKKLTARLHIYDDFESLFKVIPKELLPKDIGGDLDEAKKVLETNFKELCSPAFIKQIKFMESAATNESMRLSATFNEEYSGTPGSFKVLTVD